MKKLFVGGLAWATDEASLRAAFAKFGDITDVVIVKDNATGRSRGFGFITFQSDSAATQAFAEMNDKDLDGRKICCREAVERSSQSRGPGQDRGPGGQDRSRGPGQDRSLGQDRSRGLSQDRGLGQDRSRGPGQDRPPGRAGVEPRTFHPRVELPPVGDKQDRQRRKDRKKRKERDDGDFHEGQKNYDDRNRQRGTQKESPRRDGRTRWRGNSYNLDEDG